MLEELLKVVAIKREGKMVTLDKLFTEDDKAIVDEIICSNMIEQFGLKWIREVDEETYISTYKLFGLVAIEAWNSKRFE